MMRLILIFLIVIWNLNIAYGRNAGETEITTEEGIEVFQEEKYYLLKKNVQINSDELKLNGQVVKIYFEDDLYDIRELIANNDVSFISEQFNIKGKGENVEFNVKDQIIFVYGINSELFLETTEMLSDGKIIVDNVKGSFIINGSNSELFSEDIYINATKINGTFEIVDEKRDIVNLFVEDENKLNIKTDDIVMYSKKAVYNKSKSIIELFDEVEINRGNEIITGDYGILDTNKNSYKVSSKNSKKVKAIILGSDDE